MKSVCGLDVHKDSVYLCILSEFGELIEKVFGVLTFQLEEMRDLMLHHHVVEVSMESTSVYWIPIWRVLSPQRCNIRMSNYVSNVNSKSYKAVVRAISQGITAPEELVKLIHGRIIKHHGIDVITASLKGVVSLAEIDMISQLRDELDMAEAHKEKCQARMLEICERKFPEELRRLQTIPGIKERAATSLIAEIGTDMNKFETANHLASWSGLKPRNDESNKKIKSRSITHGNVYLRKTIIECAWAASRTKDCFFSRFSFHQTQVRKKNKMKVLVAVARKMLVAVWHVLHDNTIYIDFTTDRKTSRTRG